MRALVAQWRTEVLLGARQGEQLLVSLGIPLVVLAFFSTVEVIPSLGEDPVEVLTPSVLALAVMSSGMVSLGIGTSFERQYGVLKRLGATPLGRGRLVAAKVAFVLTVQVVQVVAVVALALALGWSGDGSWPAALGALALGTAAFSGIGLLMAGNLSGPATLAVANGTYLVLLLTSGMVVPIEELPSGVAAVARLFPAAALVDTAGGALTAGADSPIGSWVVLGGWAVAAPLVSAATFRWGYDQ